MQKEIKVDKNLQIARDRIARSPLDKLFEERRATQERLANKILTENYYAPNSIGLRN